MIRSLIRRLKAAWSTLRCDGGPIFIKESAPSDEFQIASGGNIALIDFPPSVGWQCAQGLEHCATCPRFEAYRQGLSAAKDGEKNLSVIRFLEKLKTKVSQCDGESAQVHNIDGETASTVLREGKANFDSDSHTILNPVAPGVVQAKHGAQNCNCKRDGLHGPSPVVCATVAQGGAA